MNKLKLSNNNLPTISKTATKSVIKNPISATITYNTDVNVK